MNKPSFKITAIILCAVLCLSSVVTVFALTNDKTEEQKKMRSQQQPPPIQIKTQRKMKLCMSWQEPTVLFRKLL